MTILNHASTGRTNGTAGTSHAAGNDSRMARVARHVASGLCAATILLGSMAMIPAASAADGTLTLTSGSGSTLAGHTFSIYKLATYADVVLSGNTVKSLSAQSADGATDKWLTTALDAAGVAIDTNAGQNAAAQMLRQTTGSATSRRIAANLESTVAGKTPVKSKLTSNAASLPITLPEGFYLIIDTAGMPILSSTTVSGKTVMATGATLGSVAVKGKIATPNKQIKAADGTWKDAAAATNGETREFRIRLTLPNRLAADTITIDDAMSGMEYVSGSFAATISEGAKRGTVVTKEFGTIGASPSGKGFKVTSTQALIDTYENQQLEITYRAKVTDATRANSATNTVKVTVNWLPDTTPPGKEPPAPGEDKVTVATYDFDLIKISASSTTTKRIVVAGAKFTIKNETLGKWLNWDDKTGQWTYVDTAAKAQERSTDAQGVISYDRLGAGTYLISETQVPDGYFTAIKPSFRVTIADDGTTTIVGVAQSGLTTKVTGADASATTPVAIVKNVDSMTQLPATGGTVMGAILIGGIAVLLFAGLNGTKAYRISLDGSERPDVRA